MFGIICSFLSHTILSNYLFPPPPPDPLCISVLPVNAAIFLATQYININAHSYGNMMVRPNPFIMGTVGGIGSSFRDGRLESKMPQSII